MIKVFVDSNVIISSLISPKGASHPLFAHPHLSCSISNISSQELRKITERLHLDQTSLNSLLKNKFNLVELKQSIKEIKAEYNSYTTDINDAHIVAGAKESQSQFLASYNIKDFKIDKIREDFQIKVITPATLLQYLRSIS